ncbi:hypothetical protein [Deinococcus sp.]|uniref:hypothetical protein n=1 Tax=Deinococcus sp. TaxID=47478 RepID=UPI003C7CEDD5
MRQVNNALLIPYRPATHPDSGLMLVQDRRGHRPPPWGFFGGGTLAGETSLQAVLREGAGMEWVTPEQMLTRVEADGPDEAICRVMQEMLN